MGNKCSGSASKGKRCGESPALRTALVFCRGCILLLLSCAGGLFLVVRALLSPVQAGETLPERAMGDPLMVDSEPADAASPRLRFQAARDAYYVVEYQAVPEDPAWTACDVLLREEGEQTWSGFGPMTAPCALFRLAEYPLAHPGDQDGEGMDDVWEKRKQLDPLNPEDGTQDPDGDLRSNLQEYEEGTDPRNPDIRAPSIQVLHPAPEQTVFWIP